MPPDETESPTGLEGTGFGETPFMARDHEPSVQNDERAQKVDLDGHSATTEDELVAALRSG